MSLLYKILVRPPVLQTINKIIHPKLFIKHYGTKILDKKDYIVVRALPQDYANIMDLFWESYFMSEPTTVGVGLGGSRNSVFQSKIYDGLAQGMSLIVKCKHDGSVVGAAINTAACQWEPAQMDLCADTCTCPKMAQLIRLYAHIMRAPDLWCKYCETKIFEVNLGIGLTFLTTRSGDNGRGIGYNLVKKSLELGRDLSYTLLRIDATSVHTQKICQQLGMKMVYELPYNQYKAKDGSVVVSAPPPHTSVQVYIEQPLSIERNKELRNRK